MIVEFPCKFISINYFENPSIYLNFSSYIKISPIVMSAFSWMLNFMTLQKNSLRNATIFNFWLQNMKCVIFKVIIDYAFSYSKVFIFIFNNSFLEISVKLKHLSIKLEPLDALWNSIILNCWSLRNSSQFEWNSRSQFLKNCFINIFLNNFRRF